MRLRDEIMTMGKIHSSVQEMLAQARQIVAPSVALPKNQHFEVCLPATKINQHLKEILRGPSVNYKKIERSKRYESATLENYSEKQEKQHSNLMMRFRNPSPKQLSTSLNRNAMDTIAVNIQNQLLDKRNKKPLYDKKTINLLPELPELPNKTHSKRKQSYYEEKSREWTPKYFFTITEKETEDNQPQKCHECNQIIDIQAEENANKISKPPKEQHQKSKRVKSQLLKNLEKKPTKIIKKNTTLNIKEQKIDSSFDLAYDPQPWILESKKDEYFDFNNF